MPNTKAEKDIKATEGNSRPATEAKKPRRRTPKTKYTDIVNITPEDIMRQGNDTLFSFVDPVAQRRKEIQDIEDIIEHNRKVALKGKGEYKFIVAMLTSSNETRTGDSHTSIESVTLYAVRVLPGNAAYGSLKLVFDGSDFTAYTTQARRDDEPISQNARRQRTYTNHAPMAKFQCVPIQLVYEDSDTERLNPSVICSRSFAMEQLQERYFFGPHPQAKLGGNLIASIMSVNPNGVRVEAGGIETFIPRAELTARQFITDPSLFYKPGMAIDVVIKSLEVNKETRTVHMELSGLMREIELGLVKSVKDFDLSKKPHEVAQVISVTNSFYVVRLLLWSVIGVIRKEDVRGGDELAVGDNVFMEITGVNEATNRVIGLCFKV